MNSIFMNSKNSKKSHHHKFNLTYKIDLRRKDKYIALSNLSIYYIWKNIKNSYKNNKCKISARICNEELELPDGSYSVPDIQDYFEYILKKHGEKAVNPSIRKYMNKIENRVTFKIKRGWYLELLTPETGKLLGSTKSKIIKDENGENVPYLEITEVILIHCKIQESKFKSRVYICP